MQSCVGTGAAIADAGHVLPDGLRVRGDVRRISIAFYNAVANLRQELDDLFA